MVSLRQNAGLDLPPIIVPFTELDLPMFEGLPVMGGPFAIAPTGNLSLMVKVLLGEIRLGIKEIRTTKCGKKKNTRFLFATPPNDPTPLTTAPISFRMSAPVIGAF